MAIVLEPVETEDAQFMTPVDGVDDTEDEGGEVVIPAEPVVTPDKIDDVTEVDTTEVDKDSEIDLWEGVRPPESKAKSTVPPKKKPDRFEFQQSRADKAEALAKTQAAKILELENALTDPTRVPAPAPVVKAPETDTLVKPKRPTKPEGYDPVEAVTNPTSPSAKYRYALDDFNDQLAEFNDKVAERSAQQEAVSRAEAAKAAEVRTQMNNLATELKSKYHFTDSEVRDFVNTVTSDEAMQLENLVRFYQVTKGVKKPGARRPAQQDRILREPLPLSAIGGAPNETVDEQDSFNLGLLRNSRKRKP